MKVTYHYNFHNIMLINYVFILYFLKHGKYLINLVDELEEYCQSDFSKTSELVKNFF